MIRILVVLFISCVPCLAEDGLRGKVFCGYQGWFRAPGDGSGLGWQHYGAGRSFAPGNCTIDLWPEVGELPEADRFDTPFRHRDGSVARVFSSVRPGTVDVHFKWMKEYGIDGIFLQRFVTSTRNAKRRAPLDQVLRNCRNSAAKHGRQWVLMYDLSGLKAGQAGFVREDWEHVRDDLDVADTGRDSSYLAHRGRPLIALWGLGFKDRETTLEEWADLIRFFRKEGLTVMVGVPSFWRTGERDALEDPRLVEVIKQADVISPWSVGRYGTPDESARHARETVAADLQWCRSQGKDYLPVAFPGFSWHNLKKTRGEAADVDQIPRLGGRFFWSQCRSLAGAGATALYVAMFDEIDEGTAIFKISADPPVGASPFLAREEVPSDHYLWLAGQAGRLLRGGGSTLREKDGLPVRGKE